MALDEKDIEASYMMMAAFTDREDIKQSNIASGAVVILSTLLRGKKEEDFIALFKFAYNISGEGAAIGGVPTSVSPERIAELSAKYGMFQNNANVPDLAARKKKEFVCPTDKCPGFVLWYEHLIQWHCPVCAGMFGRAETPVKDPPREQKNPFFSAVHDLRGPTK